MLVTSLLARNLRTLRDIHLELRGLTVLVGPNGSGKSTFVEICRLLSRLPSTEFCAEFGSIHGGPRALAADPEQAIEFGVSLADGSGDALTWWGALGQQGQNPAFEGELLTDASGRVALSRLGTQTTMASGIRRELPQVDPEHSMLVSALPQIEPVIAKALTSSLRSIDVHLGLDTLARWGARSVGRIREGMRDPQTLGGTRRLSVLGQNLPNVYYSLRNEQGDERWRETVETIRLGLGQDIETVEVPNIGQGEVGLRLKLRGSDTRLHASQLSDGMLAWLAFVAMVRLPHDGGMLVIDEPELHLEPRLLARVVDLLEDYALARPVLLATHSDRLLDALRDPASSIVTCTLSAERKTELARPDRAALDRWLHEFAGYGALRAAGHEAAVLKVANG